MKKYRKKPVVIEAYQFTGDNIEEIREWFSKNGSTRKIFYNFREEAYYIKTLEGDMKMSKNDFIIKGVSEEFYPCKPDIFEKTYEEVVNSL